MNKLNKFFTISLSDMLHKYEILFYDYYYDVYGYKHEVKNPKEMMRWEPQKGLVIYYAIKSKFNHAKRCPHCKNLYANIFPSFDPVKDYYGHGFCLKCGKRFELDRIEIPIQVPGLN